MGEQKKAVVKTDRSSDLVMDSAISYYDDDDPKLPYVPGELFLDNGAYTANMQNIKLKTEKIIFVQEKLKPSKTIPLDYPFKKGMSNTMMEKRWKKTADNVTFWQSSTSLGGRLVPTLHAWNKNSLRENLKWLQKHADAEYLALGSIVGPEFTNYRGFFGDRQPNKRLIDMLTLAIENIKKITDFKIHLMGLGSSPLMLHMGYYMGMDSTDSSGYRRKAAYGQIILPGTGERYVGNESTKFGRTKLSEKDLELLEACDCDVCKTNQDQLWSDWKARAIHNDHVIKKEREKAQVLIRNGQEAYEKYLEQIYKHSSFSYLWQYTKLRKKYNRISNVLFNR